MAKLIPITQNPQRYSQRANEWVISASPNVSPLTIQKGVGLSILKPVLEVDGIIVKADDWYLCSQNTLDALQASNNPHYAIESNGPIQVGRKGVVMGKSVKIIEINIDKLRDDAEAQDFQNRKAAVSGVDYIFEGDTQDGVPLNLIRQINYTLNPDTPRPSDKFSIHGLNLGDDATVYNIEKLNIETKQKEDGSLDKAKLETFLKNLQNRLTILRSDFNMIKDVFHNGTFPDSQVSIPIEQIASPGTSDGPTTEPPVTFKYTTLAAVVEAPISTPASGSTGSGDGTSTPTNGQPATQSGPVIKKLQMIDQKNKWAKNAIPVFEKDFTKGDKGKRIKNIKEGEIFWGYFIKDHTGGKQWAVYQEDKKTFIGYGYADSNDYVDEIL